MSYSLYCIFRQPLPEAFEMPDDPFVGRVFTANYNGLGAALAQHPQSDSPPDPSQLLAYERVVESFYSHSTVIPMRYGCWVGDPYDAVILLRDSQGTFRAILRELKGFTEMGIQVLLDSPTRGSGTDRLARLPVWFPSHSGVSGAADLTAARVRRHGASPVTAVEYALVENICGALHGSFVRHKVELPPSRSSRLLFLYFLVPRDSVEAFRLSARRFLAAKSLKARFSGPWPPYSFVDALRT